MQESLGMISQLSVIMPVRNIQGSLAMRVAEMLELLPELTASFELLIVDDASEDQTEEVGHELTRRYPQVRWLRLTRRSGVAEAVRIGMEHTDGEVIFVQSPIERPKAQQLSELWKLRNDDEIVVAQPQSYSQPCPMDSSLIRRLVQWGATLREEERTGGLRMIRRSALEQLNRREKEVGGISEKQLKQPSHVALGTLPSFTTAVAVGSADFATLD